MQHLVKSNTHKKVMNIFFIPKIGINSAGNIISQRMTNKRYQRK